MTDHIAALYCIVDDLLKVVEHTDDIRYRITDEEIITTSLTPANKR